MYSECEFGWIISLHTAHLSHLTRLLSYLKHATKLCICYIYVACNQYTIISNKIKLAKFIALFWAQKQRRPLYRMKRVTIFCISDISSFWWFQPHPLYKRGKAAQQHDCSRTSYVKNLYRNHTYVEILLPFEIWSLVLYCYWSAVLLRLSYVSLN